MDLLNEKYIIVEIIPTAITPQKGVIIQLSALKLEGLKLLDRFDYRLQENLIVSEDFKKMISYDKSLFTYKSSSKEILDDFKKWSLGLPLLIIDNLYTENFLRDLENKKESVFKYLSTTYNDNIIDEIIKKYDLEPSNHVVDLLYEALIKHL